MKILDCTLRDGGYYNNWDFSPSVVEAYLNSMSNAGIDYVELGLRNFPKMGFLGAYAYTTEQHLNSMDLPAGPIYGVMVDAKTILGSDLSIEDAVDALFVLSSESKIDLVRIAAHFHEVEKSGAIVKKLKSLGYTVGYNLMQSAGKSSELISEKAKQAASWNCLDVLYFADSLGNMNNFEVERIITALRKEWEGPLGIHTHDNMSKGLDNTLTAKNAGVTWLDATITGMGRGAGNTQTENLLTVLDQDGSSYNPQPIYDLVIRHFEPMQKKYGWGSNLLYFLGAQNDVHPTYIQNLLSNSQYGTEEIIGAIAYLSNLEETTAYNGIVLQAALNFNTASGDVSGSDALVDLFKDREVLVLANGISTKTYSKAIELYIKERQPIVLSLNINESISSDLINYYVISHNVKFLSDANKYKKILKPIILPKHRFTVKELENFNHLNILDYGFVSDAESLEINKTFISSSLDYTSAYLLGVLVVGQPKSIKLAGFDGYDKNDVRQQDMIDLINQYNALGNSLPLVSITPSLYPIYQGSVYAIHS